jgi:Calcineurin-like phosphoesterase
MALLDQAAPLYRGRLRRGLAFLLPACVTALVALHATGIESQTPAGPRIVVVGDIHGAGTNLAQILQAAGLIDAQRKWSGGTARLVQTGDILDRGAEVREAIDLLMRLEGEARRAGGRVDVLFGNHEGMTVMRDYRDVLAGFERFTDGRSEDRQQKAFETHAAIAKRAGATLDRDAWLKAHPRGSIEYAEAFGPSGKYGRWIRARKPILQIDDTIFMHAGLNPERTITIDEINRQVEQEVRSWDELVLALEQARLAAPFFTVQEIVNAAQVEIGRIAVAQKTNEPLPEHVTQEFVKRLQFLINIDKLALIEADGPLWYRGLATLPDDQRPAVEAMLKRYGARRIVIGHTPQLPEGRIRSRFDGLVVLIDTGMLSTYFKGGRPSALELQGGRMTAIYTSGREPIVSGTASLTPVRSAANAH